MLRGSAPTKKRVKCCWTSQQPGGPPKPVAKPIVPSEASISTRKEPRTLMPQLVRDLRYCSHCDAGVEIGESMSLCSGVKTSARPVTGCEGRYWGLSYQ